MSIISDSGKVQIACDGHAVNGCHNGCKAVWPHVVERADLDVILTDAKSAGWRIYKMKDGFNHACPSCVRAWLADGARAAQGRPDANQGELL